MRRKKRVAVKKKGGSPERSPSSFILPLSFEEKQQVHISPEKKQRNSSITSSRTINRSRMLVPKVNISESKDFLPEEGHSMTGNLGLTSRGKARIQSPSMIPRVSRANANKNDFGVQRRSFSGSGPDSTQRRVDGAPTSQNPWTESKIDKRKVVTVTKRLKTQSKRKKTTSSSGEQRSQRQRGVLRKASDQPQLTVQGSGMTEPPNHQPSPKHSIFNPIAVQKAALERKLQKKREKLHLLKVKKQRSKARNLIFKNIETLTAQGQDQMRKGIAIRIPDALQSMRIASHTLPPGISTGPRGRMGEMQITFIKLKWYGPQLLYPVHYKLAPHEYTHWDDGGNEGSVSKLEATQGAVQGGAVQGGSVQGGSVQDLLRNTPREPRLVAHWWGVDSGTTSSTKRRNPISTLKPVYIDADGISTKDTLSSSSSGKPLAVAVDRSNTMWYPLMARPKGLKRYFSDMKTLEFTLIANTSIIDSKKKGKPSTTIASLFGTDEANCNSSGHGVTIPIGECHIDLASLWTKELVDTLTKEPTSTDGGNNNTNQGSTMKNDTVTEEDGGSYRSVSIPVTALVYHPKDREVLEQMRTDRMGNDEDTGKVTKSSDLREPIPLGHLELWIAIRWGHESVMQKVHELVNAPTSTSVGKEESSNKTVLASSLSKSFPRTTSKNRGEKKADTHGSSDNVNLRSSFQLHELMAKYDVDGRLPTSPPQRNRKLLTGSGRGKAAVMKRHNDPHSHIISQRDKRLRGAKATSTPSYSELLHYGAHDLRSKLEIGDSFIHDIDQLKRWHDVYMSLIRDVPGFVQFCTALFHKRSVHGHKLVDEEHPWWERGMLNPPPSLLHAFDIMDFNHTGTLEKDELQKVFRRLDIILGEKDFDDLFEKFDLDKTGCIELQEFLGVLERAFASHLRWLHHGDKAWEEREKALQLERQKRYAALHRLPSAEEQRRQLVEVQERWRTMNKGRKLLGRFRHSGSGRAILHDDDREDGDTSAMKSSIKNLEASSSSSSSSATALKPMLSETFRLSREELELSDGRNKDHPLSNRRSDKFTNSERARRKRLEKQQENQGQHEVTTTVIDSTVTKKSDLKRVNDPVTKKSESTLKTTTSAITASSPKDRKSTGISTNEIQSAVRKDEVNGTPTVVDNLNNKDSKEECDHDDKNKNILASDDIVRKAWARQIVQQDEKDQQSIKTIEPKTMEPKTMEPNEKASDASPSSSYSSLSLLNLKKNLASRKQHYATEEKKNKGKEKSQDLNSQSSNIHSGGDRGTSSNETSILHKLLERGRHLSNRMASSVGGNHGAANRNIPSLTMNSFPESTKSLSLPLPTMSSTMVHSETPLTLPMSSFGQGALYPSSIQQPRLPFGSLDNQESQTGSNNLDPRTDPRTLEVLRQASKFCDTASAITSTRASVTATIAPVPPQNTGKTSHGLGMSQEQSSEQKRNPRIRNSSTTSMALPAGLTKFFPKRKLERLTGLQNCQLNIHGLVIRQKTQKSIMTKGGHAGGGTLSKASSMPPLSKLSALDQLCFRLQHKVLPGCYIDETRTAATPTQHSSVSQIGGIIAKTSTAGNGIVGNANNNKLDTIGSLIRYPENAREDYHITDLAMKTLMKSEKKYNLARRTRKNIAKKMTKMRKSKFIGTRKDTNARRGELLFDTDVNSPSLKIDIDEKKMFTFSHSTMNPSKLIDQWLTSSLEIVCKVKSPHRSTSGSPRRRGRSPQRHGAKHGKRVHPWKAIGAFKYPLRKAILALLETEERNDNAAATSNLKTVNHVSIPLDPLVLDVVRDGQVTEDEEVLDEITILLKQLDISIEFSLHVETSRHLSSTTPVVFIGTSQHEEEDGEADKGERKLVKDGTGSIIEGSLVTGSTFGSSTNIPSVMKSGKQGTQEALFQNPTKQSRTNEIDPLILSLASLPLCASLVTTPAIQFTIYGFENPSSSLFQKNTLLKMRYNLAAALNPLRGGTTKVDEILFHLQDADNDHQDKRKKIASSSLVFTSFSPLSSAERRIVGLRLDPLSIARLENAELCIEIIQEEQFEDNSDRKGEVFDDANDSGNGEKETKNERIIGIARVPLKGFFHQLRRVHPTTCLRKAFGIQLDNIEVTDLRLGITEQMTMTKKDDEGKKEIKKIEEEEQPQQSLVLGAISRLVIDLGTPIQLSRRQTFRLACRTIVKWWRSLSAQVDDVGERQKSDTEQRSTTRDAGNGNVQIEMVSLAMTNNDSKQKTESNDSQSNDSLSNDPQSNEPQSNESQSNEPLSNNPISLIPEPQSPSLLQEHIFDFHLVGFLSSREKIAFDIPFSSDLSTQSSFEFDHSSTSNQYRFVTPVSNRERLKQVLGSCETDINFTYIKGKFKHELMSNRYTSLPNPNLTLKLTLTSL
eukprot:g367.t1